MKDPVCTYKKEVLLVEHDFSLLFVCDFEYSKTIPPTAGQETEEIPGLTRDELIAPRSNVKAIREIRRRPTQNYSPRSKRRKLLQYLERAMFYFPWSKPSLRKNGGGKDPHRKKKDHSEGELMQKTYQENPKRNDPLF